MAFLSILEHDDYRAILREELERRQTKNLNYSQRAFARDLGIGPNRLSEILRGKQGLSPAYAKQLAGELGYTRLESDYFCEMVRERHARSERERSLARKRILRLRKEVQYHELDLEAFKIISEWYHLAIIELSKTKNFEPKSGWIAERLGIDECAVKVALNRLEYVGLLKRRGRSLEFTETNNNLPSTIPSDAIKRFHEGLLKKATESLWEQSVEERDFSATMIAIDESVLPEIKRRIDQFWKRIDEDFGGLGNPTRVYALGTQFFALSGRTGD